MRGFGEQVTGSWHVWQDDADDAAPAKKKKPKAPRRLTGKCWMAEDFPMTLHQLLPILEVGPALCQGHMRLCSMLGLPHDAAPAAAYFGGGAALCQGTRACAPFQGHTTTCSTDARSCGAWVCPGISQTSCSAVPPAWVFTHVSWRAQPCPGRLSKKCRCRCACLLSLLYVVCKRFSALGGGERQQAHRARGQVPDQVRGAGAVPRKAAGKFALGLETQWPSS